MDFERFSSDESEKQEESEKEENNLPYLSMIFTKNGISKIESGKSIYKLPLKDLKEPPKLGNIYTVGDLILLLKKHNYLLELGK